MDIYLKNRKTGEHIRFPTLPEELPVTADAAMATCDIMDRGPVKIPNGNEPDTLTWSAEFPGRALQSHSVYRGAFQDPAALTKKIDTWKREGDPCTVLITETPVNMDVVISSFQYTFHGAFGSVRYSITLVEQRPIEILSTRSAEVPAALPRGDSGLSEVRTHTVVRGDCLWNIAQTYLGAGTRWGELYELNKDTIDAANAGKKVVYTTIYPGQVFRIPN